MEIRQVIIQSVLQALQGKAEPEVLDTVQDVLVIQLNQYEIQERSTVAQNLRYQTTVQKVC